MITDSEFVMIKNFDRTIDQRDAEIARANGIIRNKNALLIQAGARIAAQADRIAALEAALAAEKAKNVLMMAQVRGMLRQK